MKIFASQLRRLPVTDPVGERIGRVSDIVVTMMPGAAPRLMGLLVSVERKPVFIGSGMIGAIAAQGVSLRSARINLRRYEQRPGELRVLGELLDRTAIDEGGTQVRINDVAIERVRTGWEILAVDVRELRGPLHRGRSREVPWSRISGIRVAETAASRAALLSDARPADIAEALLELEPAEQQRLFEALGDERAADALQEMETDDATCCSRRSRPSAWATCSMRWTPRTPPTCCSRSPRTDVRR